MNETIQQAIKSGIEACQEHGFGFISIYQTRSEESVSRGWDRFIISPAHVSEKEYRFVGIARADGTAEVKN